MVAKGQRSFAAGELTPLLHARSDLEQYHIGLAGCRDMIVMPQGGATRRPGTLDMGAAKTAAGEVRLEELIFNRTQSYSLELGEEYARIWTQGAQLVSGGSPVEVATPYAEDELELVWPLGAGDVLYLLHEDHPPAQIRRLGATSFDYHVVVFENGPFLERNGNKTHKLTASAATGTGVTLTASGSGFAPFTAGHVGALWRLDQDDLSSLPKWAGNVSVALADMVWSFGAAYECTAAGTTVNAPDHAEGEQPDQPGASPVKWLFRHKGFGIVRVTGYTSPTVVTVEVVRELPATVVSDGCWKWQEGAWSAHRGYPAVGMFQEQRFTLAGGRTRPGGVWTSRTATFADFEAGDEATAAILYTIAARQQHPIVWMGDGKRLAIGTTGGEWTVGSSSVREPLTPTNIVIQPETQEGGAPIVPATINGVNLFVTADRRRLHELAYDYQRDGFAAPEISVLSEHLLRPGVKKICWQARPFRTLWLVLQNGGLVGVTYRREQEMIAFHAHDPGGSVLSACAVPTADGKSDELVLAVRRTVNGAPSTRIERMAQPWLSDAGDPLAAAVYLDSALTYDGAATDTFDGLDHLEGETLGVLGDGAWLPDVVVSGGSVTVSRAVSRATIGLRYTSRLRTLSIDEGLPDGTARGRMRRINEVAVSLFETMGGKLGRPFRAGQDVEPYELINPSGGVDWAGVVQLVTDDKMVGFPGGHDRIGEVELEFDAPGPATVLAITPQFGASPQ